MEKDIFGNIAFIFVGRHRYNKGNCSCSINDVYGLQELMLNFSKGVEPGNIDHNDCCLRKGYVDDVNSLVNNGNGLLVISAVRSIPVGYILGHRNYPFIANGSKRGFFIVEEYVAEELRGRGIYSAMLNLVADEVKRMNRTAIFKEVYYDNAMAINASKAKGFEIVKKAIPEKGLEHVLMIKRVR